MNAISLFAGIGGFDLAFQRVFAQPVFAAAEINPQAASVLQLQLPPTHFFPNVQNIRRNRWYAPIPDGTNQIDIVTAGWPCQGNSVAGRRAGMSDARSGLWSEVVRVLKTFRPTWFVGENVPGLLSVNHGQDFKRVLFDLAKLGYGFAYRVLDAQYFGVPQRRRRVFVVGHFGDWRRAAEVLFEPESLCRDLAPQRQTKPALAACLTSGSASGSKVNHGRRCEDDWNLVAPTLLAKSNLSQEAQSDTLICCTLPASDGGASSGMHPIVAVPDPAYADTGQGSRFGSGRQGQDTYVIRPAVRRLTPLECERLQGFPDGWTETGHDGRALSDGARRTMLGNAVAVPVVRWIMERLREVDHRKNHARPKR